MPGEPCTVSAPGCFGLWPRKLTPANLNKKGIHRRVAGQFTEPKKAKVQISKKGGSLLPWGFRAAAPQGCSLGGGEVRARGDRSAQASPLLAPSHVCRVRQECPETVAGWPAGALDPGLGQRWADPEDPSRGQPILQPKSGHCEREGEGVLSRQKQYISTASFQPDFVSDHWRTPPIQLF